MCFSLWWFAQLLILLVLVAATIAILKLLIPFAMKWAGYEAGEGVNLIFQVIRIVVGAIIIIFVIYIVVSMISCLWGYSGGLSLLPGHR